MKKLLIILPLLLTACAKPVTTYVPIKEANKTDLGDAPTYSVGGLRETDKAHPDIVAKAYVSSLGQCIADDQYIRSVCK